MYLFFAMITLTFNLAGCKPAIIHDAQKLALVQKQKNEKVREILRCGDLKEKMLLANELKLLDTMYNKLKQDFERKYSDSLDKAHFDILFLKEMGEISKTGDLP
jgi:hypothetical protein